MSTENLQERLKQAITDRESIEKNIKEIQNEIDKSKTTYRIGQRIKSNWGEHILAQTEPHRVCAIGLGSGNRYRDPVEVGHIYHITVDEMNKICGSNFKVI